MRKARYREVRKHAQITQCYKPMLPQVKKKEEKRNLPMVIELDLNLGIWLFIFLCSWG